MAAVNDLVAIEKTMSPDDVIKLRATFPTLLEALRIQQVVINQVIGRVGGSGTGTTVVDLSALTERVTASENAIGEVLPRAFKREPEPDQDQGHFLTTINIVLKNQKMLLERIEEVEAICLSSLARL